MTPSSISQWNNNWPCNALELNPPKIFLSIGIDFPNFVMQLRLIFNSSPTRYVTDSTQMNYKASYSTSSSKKGFRPQGNQLSSLSDFHTCQDFFSALKAANNDPDAWAIGKRKMRASRQGPHDCILYHTDFVPLATILNLDHRHEIKNFHNGHSNTIYDALIV